MSTPSTRTSGSLTTWVGGARKSGLLKRASLLTFFFLQLSPSFNWSAAGLNEQEMKSYVWDLGKLGFVWQFITVSALRNHLAERHPLTFHFCSSARRSSLKRLHLGLLCQGLLGG